MDCYILSEEIQDKLKSPYLLYEEKIELFRTYIAVEALIKDKLLSLETEIEVFKNNKGKY
jgi:hypothetical protein